MVLKKVIVGFNMMVLVDDDQEITKIIKNYAGDEAQNCGTIFSLVKCQEIKRFENLPTGWDDATPWSTIDINDITCRQFLDGEDPMAHKAKAIRAFVLCENCTKHGKLYQCLVCDEVLCDKCLKMHGRECFPTQEKGK
ncbi:hypothetical protein LCGC14_1760740 [marine sediment metagenome]|uniref:Uncharacterized protein n=1 Tax=marine sediment metagenome TaxID=412755 RepID=A0A0F9JG86_9ZZZZ